MQSFEFDMLESFLEGVFSAHPNKTLAETSGKQAKGLVQYLKSSVDGRFTNVDVARPKTTGYAYLHAFSKSVVEGRDICFVKLSLITGKNRVKDSEETSFRFQYCDLIVDRKLHNFATAMAESEENILKKQMFKVEITSAHFEPSAYKGKPQINSLGYLTGLEVTN